MEESSIAEVVCLWLAALDLDKDYNSLKYVVDQVLLLKIFTYDRMEIKVLGLPGSLRQRMKKKIP